MLDSIKSAVPSDWPQRVDELRSLGDVGLADFLDESGLDLDDVYGANRSWTELRRAAGFLAASGCRASTSRRSCGRSAGCCTWTTTNGCAATPAWWRVSGNRMWVRCRSAIGACCGCWWRRCSTSSARGIGGGVRRAVAARRYAG